MSNLRRAAIVTPFYVDNDAVSNDVFHFTNNLRGQGWDARVFAIGRHRSNDAAEPLADMPAFVRTDDLLLYHFSTGCPEAIEQVERASGVKVLRYHNITPAEMFSVWCDDLAEATRKGREELPRVCGVDWRAVWAASRYNLRELTALLPPHVRQSALAPFHEVAALTQTLTPGARPSADNLLRVLFVGRLAPSKGHAFLLRVVRYAVHELGLSLNVQIVGKADHRLKGYEVMLHALVKEFDLAHAVTFTGEVSPQQLADQYDRANVFLCTSDHEGFCVPLVEAMAFGVPIVALGTSAIPETVGDAGLVFFERDPRRFAVALKTFVDRPEVGEHLAALARARYSTLYSPEVMGRALAHEMNEITRLPR